MVIPKPIHYSNNYSSDWLIEIDFRDYEHLLEFSDLYIAVLFKDGARLRSLLHNGEASDANGMEQYELHELGVCVRWVEGCQVLLGNRVELCSPGYKKPLFHDIACHNADNMLEFWVDTRANLEPKAIESLGSLEYLLDQVARAQDFCSVWVYLDLRAKRINIAITALCKQRRDLETLAIKNVENDMYFSQSDRLLDVQAWSVCHILERKGIFVPLSLRPSRNCVYHFGPDFEYDTDVLEAIYQAGFKDLAYEQNFGKDLTFVTPLLFLLSHSTSHLISWASILSALDWFLVKGSNIRERWPNSAIRGIHLLGWLLGNFLPNAYVYKAEWRHMLEWSTDGLAPYLDDEASRERQRSDIRIWRCAMGSLADNTSDSCSCRCSMGGCIPVTLLCRSFLKSLWRRECSPVECRPLHVTAKSIMLLCDPNIANNRWIVTALIRFFTFSKLEIRHTCCDLRGFTKVFYNQRGSNITCKPEPFWSPKDTLRIQDEDQYLVKVLEVIVPEFDKLYDAFDLPFDDFFERLMLPSINNVLESLAQEDHKLHSEGRRDMGVVMDPLSGRITEEEDEVGEESSDGEEDELGEKK